MPTKKHHHFARAVLPVVFLALFLLFFSEPIENDAPVNSVQAPARAAAMVPAPQRRAEASLELDKACLDEAYPGLILAVERTADGKILFVTAKGPLVYDDGRTKTYEEELACGDIEDAMRDGYPLEPSRPDLAPNEDPGRVRAYDLLHVLYGAEEKTVAKGLVNVTVCRNRLRVAQRIQNAMTEIGVALDALCRDDPSLKKYVRPMGAYYWRTIAGTNRRSAHAYGIAVDLNPKYAGYWRWSGARPHPEQKTFPPAIVALFEKQGFIWGGKWEHFDLMHFEYRPELIIKARRLADALKDSAQPASAR